MTMTKLENFACFNDDDFRVVSVDVERTVTSTEPYYAKTTLTINSMHDDIAHRMDDRKWLDGNLELQLIKAIDNAEDRQSYETFINFYKTLKGLD